MQNAALYPKNRYLMGILNTLCCSLTHSLNLVAAPVLIYIAQDFGIDTATAGYASTLHMLAQGIFMLASPIMIGWIDNKRTQLAGIAIMVAGALMSYWSPSFSALLISRFITGAGHGICSGCSSAVIAAWFPPGEKPLFVTANSLAVVLITTLTYTCAVPLYNLFGGSWRLVMLSLGIMLAVLNVFWIIYYRDNHALNAFLKERDALEGKKSNPFTGMKEALSRRDVWMFWMFMGLASIGANGITAYMPSFLHEARGFTEAHASSIVGVASGVSAAATLAGGIVTTALGKRKIIIIPTAILSTVFLVISLVSGNPTFITAAFILYNICYNFRGPAQGTISTELKNVTPALTSSAATVSFGIGFIGSFLTSPMLQHANKIIGEEYSMLVFIPLFALSFVFALLLPETGPGRTRTK